MSPTARRLWLAVWITLAAFLVVRAAGRPNDRGVILDHLEFGHRLLHGEDLYALGGPRAPERPLHAPYPPSFGLLTAPLVLIDATFGLRVARAAWGLLEVGSLLALGLVLSRLPSGRAPPSRTAFHVTLLVTLLVGARFVLRDAHGGGGNLINLGLCALAFLLAERHRPLAAGLLLGFSLATKPTQVWLLPVFWLLGHRRAVLFALAAATTCALLSLALLRFDTGPWLRWLQGSWAIATQTDAFAVPALGFPEFEWMNQSLRCACARWLGTVPDAFAARVHLGLWPNHGLGLGVAAAAWATRLISLAGLAGVLFVAHRARHAANSPARLYAFAAALALSLLLSPLSWKAHHVALLPLFFLLLRALHERRSRALAALLAAFVLLCAFGGDLIGDDRDEWLNSVYVVTAFDVLLLGVAIAQAQAQAQSRVPTAPAPAPA